MKPLKSILSILEYDNTWLDREDKGPGKPAYVICRLTLFDLPSGAEVILATENEIKEHKIPGFSFLDCEMEESQRRVFKTQPGERDYSLQVKIGIFGSIRVEVRTVQGQAHPKGCNKIAWHIDPNRKRPIRDVQHRFRFHYEDELREHRPGRFGSKDSGDIPDTWILA